MNLIERYKWTIKLTKVKRAKPYQILNDYLVNHAKCKLWPRFYLLTYGLEKCCMYVRGFVFFLFSSISGKQSHFDFHKAKHAQWHPLIATNIHISYNRNENCGMNIDQGLICQAILLAQLDSALLYNFNATLCIQYDSAKDNWLD